METQKKVTYTKDLAHWQHCYSIAFELGIREHYLFFRDKILNELRILIRAYGMAAMLRYERHQQANSYATYRMLSTNGILCRFTFSGRTLI